MGFNFVLDIKNENPLRLNSVSHFPKPYIMTASCRCLEGYDSETNTQKWTLRLDARTAGVICWDSIELVSS